MTVQFKKKFTTEFYCAKCDAGYRYFDGECPTCATPTVERKVEVTDYEGVFRVRMDKLPKGRVDVRDTDQVKDNFLKECVDKAKFNLRRGKTYAINRHPALRNLHG